MAEFWYKMVKSGKWSIERVPAKYRDAVKVMLETEEK